jgi:hypothetical protein
LLSIDRSRLLEASRYALRLCAYGLNADFVPAMVQEQTLPYEMVLPPTTDVLKRISGAFDHRTLEGAEALFPAAGMPFEH